MRFVQVVFGMVRPHKSSDALRNFTVVAMLLLNLICQAIVLVAMQDYAKIPTLTVTALVLEFVIWDSLLMPGCLAICGQVNSKVLNYF
jgi:hypothetical protein